MKLKWSFHEIKDKPSSNGFRHCSSQRRPKLTLRLPRITIDTSESVSPYKRSLRRCMRNKKLRSANNKCRCILPFDSLTLINKPNKEYSSLFYYFVFRNKFIDLVLFLARLHYPCYFTYERSCRSIDTETRKYNKDEYSLFSLLIKRWKIMIFIVRRPQYSISHGQRLNDRL